MEELNAALHKFNQNIVEASRQVCRETLAFCMTQVILPLFEKIGEVDVRFKCTSPMPNEAYFEGMKTTGINEFELTVLLTHLLTVKVFEDVGIQDNNLLCYGHIIPQQAPHPLGDVLVESGPTQGLLSAYRLRHLFSQLASRAASVLPVSGITLEIIHKDPHTVVKIFRGPDVFIFRLVPTLMFQQEWPSSAAAWPEETNEWLTENEVKFVKDYGVYAQALPCPTSPADPSLFRFSFSMGEKYLLRTRMIENSKQGRISRKDPERILRIIRESDKDDFHPISSYHMKTVLLHECLRWPDPGAWAPEKLAERFLELLRDLILALENQELPHFFIRDYNLLRHYPTEQLSAAAGRLRAIYQDIYVSPSDSIRLQC